MSPQHIAIVQDTFSAIEAVADEAALMFYERLFRLRPELRLLFRNDMHHQRKMFMSVLGSAVAGLSNLEMIAPMIRDLGARHAGYKVQFDQYELTRDALLWTIEELLKEECTPQVRQAWSAAYELVAEMMKTGYGEPPAQGRP